MKNKKQTRNLKGQFAKEEPYSRLASLCGFLVIVASIALVGINIARQDKKIETTIRLDKEMIAYTRAIVVSQEQQAEADKALAEQVKEEVKEVKQEVKAVAKKVGIITKQNDYLKIEEAAKKVCAEKSFGEQCVKDLLGISYAEHKDFNCSRKGDGGKSRGCFQIYKTAHPEITDEQANNIELSARWTLNRMIHYNYPEYRSQAIRRHNGNPYIQQTKDYLDTVNYFVNQY